MFIYSKLLKDELAQIKLEKYIVLYFAVYNSEPAFYLFFFEKILRFKFIEILLTKNKSIILSNVILKNMVNRRNFLKSSAAVVVGGLVADQLATSCTPTSKKKIGLQLYSLRDAIKDDVKGTLKKVAEMGYSTVETAGYNDGKVYGLAPIEFKKIVEDLGMKVSSAHVVQVFMKEKEAEIMEWWKKASGAHAVLGVKYLVQAFMPVNEQTTMDEIKLYCDYYNNVGYITAAAGGIGFGYHNHSFEFRKIGEKLIYDFMLENTSPNHVFFEMDVYWITEGGQSAAGYINKYTDRFPVLHIKDEKELGVSGKMDFKPIFEAAYSKGLKEYYVEVEKYTGNDPFLSVKQSFDYLANAEYVK